MFNLYIIPVLAVTALYGAAVVEDARYTIAGIKQKVAVEKNTWLVGKNPTLLKLLVRDSLFLGPWIALGIFTNPIVYLVPTAIAAYKHMQGAEEWEKDYHVKL